MKKRPWTAILVIGGRPFPDRDFDCYREFLESRTVLIVCQCENAHRALLFLSGWIVSGLVWLVSFQLTQNNVSCSPGIAAVDGGEFLRLGDFSGDVSADHWWT